MVVPFELILHLSLRLLLLSLPCYSAQEGVGRHKVAGNGFQGCRYDYTPPSETQLTVRLSALPIYKGKMSSL